MDNELTAMKINGSGTKIRLEDRDFIGLGSEGVVRRAEVTVEGQKGERSIFLAHKKLFHPESAIHLQRNYEVARSAGLSVPSTFRVVHQGLLMTDLTNNGVNIVLSYNDLSRKRLRFINDHYPELVQAFKRLDITEVFQQYQQELNRASAARIKFTESTCWFFIVEPSGNQRIILGDFKDMESHSPESNLEEWNNECFEIFKTTIKAIQDLL